jgi:hypothetical protein
VGHSRHKHITMNSSTQSPNSRPKNKPTFLNKSRNERIPTRLEILEFELLLKKLFDLPLKPNGTLNKNALLRSSDNRQKDMKRFEELRKKLYEFANGEKKIMEEERQGVQHLRNDFVRYLQMKYGRITGNNANPTIQFNYDGKIKLPYSKLKINKLRNHNGTLTFEPNLVKFTTGNGSVVNGQNATKINEYTRNLILQLMNILELIEQHRIAGKHGMLTKKNLKSLNLLVDDYASMQESMKILRGEINQNAINATVIAKQIKRQIEEGHIDEYIEKLTEKKAEKIISVIQAFKGKGVSINFNDLIGNRGNRINLLNNSKKRIENAIQSPIAAAASASATTVSSLQYPPNPSHTTLPESPKYLLPLEKSLLRHVISHLIYSIIYGTPLFRQMPLYESMLASVPEDGKRFLAFNEDIQVGLNSMIDGRISFKMNNTKRHFLQLPDPVIETTNGNNSINIQHEINLMEMRNQFDLDKNKFLLLKLDYDSLSKRYDRITIAGNNYLIINNEYYLIQDVIYRVNQRFDKYVVSTLRMSGSRNENLIYVYDQSIRAANTISSGASRVAKKISSGASRVAKKISSGASEAGKKISSGASEAGKKISSGASEAGKKISSGASEAGKKISSAVKGVGSRLSQFRRNASSSANSSSSGIELTQSPIHPGQNASSFTTPSSSASLATPLSSGIELTQSQSPMHRGGGKRSDPNATDTLPIPGIGTGDRAIPIVILLRKVPTKDYTVDILKQITQFSPLYSIYQSIGNNQSITLPSLFKSFYSYFGFNGSKKLLYLKSDAPTSDAPDTLSENHISNIAFKPNRVFKKYGSHYIIDVDEFQYYFTLYDQLQKYFNPDTPNPYLASDDYPLSQFLMNINLNITKNSNKQRVKTIEYIHYKNSQNGTDSKDTCRYFFKSSTGSIIGSPVFMNHDQLRSTQHLSN